MQREGRWVADPTPGRVFEEAEVDGEGHLVVDCDDVPEEEADLANPKCLRAVLDRLREEPGIKGVVLEHDRRRAYGPRAMAVLLRIVAIARVLDQFASREPSPEFPGFTAKETAAVCAKCELRPATLFANLRERVLTDPASFLAEMRTTASALAAYTETGCTGCAGATVQDLAVLLADLEQGPGG